MIRFDAVSRFTKRAYRCLGIITASIHRYAFPVVYPVDIHLAAAISTIHQSSEWVCFAPAVGITPYLPSDALYIVKGFLVDNLDFPIILNSRVVI